MKPRSLIIGGVLVLAIGAAVLYSFNHSAFTAADTSWSGTRTRSDR